jgi:hypothetical protein
MTQKPLLWVEVGAHAVRKRRLWLEGAPGNTRPFLKEISAGMAPQTNSTGRKSIVLLSCRWLCCSFLLIVVVVVVASHLCGDCSRSRGVFRCIFQGRL